MPERFVSHESLVEIGQSHFTIGSAVIDVHASQSTATAIEVCIEVHPLSLQRREPLTMPEKARQPIKLS